MRAFLAFSLPELCALYLMTNINTTGTTPI